MRVANTVFFAAAADVIDLIAIMTPMSEQ